MFICSDALTAAFGTLNVALAIVGHVYIRVASNNGLACRRGVNDYG